MSTNLAHLTQLPLPTGVPGLDEVLGGGIPESSFTVIGGGPGTGKSTLAHQILMANVSHERPGVYFFGPGQRCLEQAHPDIHDIYLGDQLAERDACRVLDLLVRETYNHHACFVVVDLVRGLTHNIAWDDIMLYLSTIGATSILISDGDESDSALSAADVVVWLRQSSSPSTSRTVQVMKARGQEPLLGPHAMRVTHEGMHVFPRWSTPPRRVVQRWRSTTRLSVGIDELDRLLGGGAPSGGAVLVEGPSGSGKSILATQFVTECGHDGYPGLVLLFEERPERFIARAESLNLELERLNRCGVVDVLSFRGRDLSADELIYEVQRAVTLIGAHCVVIDSTAGLELIVKNDDVVDCLWRLLDSLARMGVTVWLNDTPSAARRPSLHALVDDVIHLRRVEHDGQRERRLEVVKVSCHTSRTGVHQYEIGQRGVEFVTRIEDDQPQPHSTNGHLIGYNGFAVSRSA